MEIVELKPCPLCGESVNARKVNSSDGTIVWIRIMHGPSIPCGISFLEDASEAIEKWNSRKYDTLSSNS